MRRRRGIHFETSYWPLLLVRFESHISDDEFAAYLDQLSTMLARRERHALVLDATAGSLPPLAHARMQASWLRRHRGEIAELCAGTAFVFPSRLFRHALNAVFMIQPLPSHFHVFDRTEAAVAWAAARLGVEAPATKLVWSDEDTTSPTVKPDAREPEREP